MRSVMPSARPRRSRRTAFSMVELLLATALAALLMGGVMSMVTSLAGNVDEGPALARMKAEGNIDVALRSVAWDVANGRYGTIRSGPAGGMTLVGTGRTDDRGPMASPAVVSYSLVEAGGLNMLVRRERGPAESEGGGRANVVLVGVDAFAVSPVRLPRAARVRPAKPRPTKADASDGDGDDDGESDEDQKPDDLYLQSLAAGARPLPRALRVRLTVAGGGLHEVVLETGARDVPLDQPGGSDE